MLRFIIKNRWCDGTSGAEGEYLKTIDIDAPELQYALTIDGYGQAGYDIASLVGVEILPNEKAEHP